jgi:hypothetical protein
MRNLKVSTAVDIMVFMTSSTDHVTGKEALTLTITASKNGLAFASITPTAINERGNGWYDITLSTSHTDTLGPLALHITGTGADPTDCLFHVLSNNLQAADDVNSYQAKTWIFRDTATSVDRYIVAFFKNGQPITTGISSPTIQVIKATDGADLITVVGLTQIASLGLYKRDEPTNRIIVGSGYLIKTQATVDSASRTWYQPIGRDS